jgi:hypothetical protein
MRKLEFAFVPSSDGTGTPAPRAGYALHRWRQSPYTRSATAVGALAIPSPRRGSFLERLSCEQINTGPVARVLDTASGWVLAATKGSGAYALQVVFSAVANAITSAIPKMFSVT